MVVIMAPINQEHKREMKTHSCPELPLGRLLKQRISGQMTGPLAVSAEAQAYTAAAGEAG